MRLLLIALGCFGLLVSGAQAQQTAPNAVNGCVYNSGGVTLTNYSLFSVLAQCELGRGVQLFGRVENLFDAKYQTVYGYNQPGFGAYLGVRYRELRRWARKAKAELGEEEERLVGSLALAEETVHRILLSAEIEATLAEMTAG